MIGAARGDAALSPAGALPAPAASRKRRSPPPESGVDGDPRKALSTPHGRAAPPAPLAAAAAPAFYSPTKSTPVAAADDAAAAAISPVNAGLAHRLAAAAPAAPGAAAPPRRHVTFASAPPPPAARLWTYVDCRGCPGGPSTAAELRTLLAAGDVAGSSMMHSCDDDAEAASMPLRAVLGLEPSPPKGPAPPALRRTGAVAAAFARSAAAAALERPPPPPLPGAPPAPVAEWRYVDPGGVTRGPFSRAELAAWLAHRYLPPELRVFRGRAGGAQEGLTLAEVVARAESPQQPSAAHAAAPAGAGADVALRKAVRLALKLAVSDAAKEVLQPRYNAGALDRERFKACVAATVAKVENAMEKCGLQRRWRSGADATAWVAEPLERERIQKWAVAKADRAACAADAAATASPADEL